MYACDMCECRTCKFCTCVMEWKAGCQDGRLCSMKLCKGCYAKMKDEVLK